MDKSVDSDIRNLYASFDGAAETYREVYREEQCSEAARRWRLLGKVVATMEHSAAQTHPALLQPTAPASRRTVDACRARASASDSDATTVAVARDGTSRSDVPAPQAQGKPLESLFQRLSALPSELPPRR
ncbi:MAG: BcsR/BcsP family cellulose biosynthesis protein [Gammaproteobacteria bacterium]